MYPQINFVWFCFSSLSLFSFVFVVVAAIFFNYTNLDEIYFHWFQNMFTNHQFLMFNKNVGEDVHLGRQRRGSNISRISYMVPFNFKVLGKFGLCSKLDECLAQFAP